MSIYCQSIVSNTVQMEKYECIALHVDLSGAGAPKILPVKWKK